jgi:Ohr subfamily peroxiredoxin
MSVKTLYRTSATSTGGREGHTRTEDGRVELQLSTPKELGGAGGPGTNPEQLFAAGYSACFLGAMKAVSGMQKVTLPPDTAIDASVDLGKAGEAYGIAARLNISIPGMERDAAQKLVDAAHQACPYSRATRGNIDVTLTLV